MKAFIAYRHTGEKEEVLNTLLGSVVKALKDNGVEAYCTFFAEDEFQSKVMSARDIMDHAFDLISEKDVLFVLQASELKSEGMLMEVGYAIAKDIPVIVCTHESVEHTYLPEMSTLSLTYSNIENLVSSIGEIDFADLA